MDRIANTEAIASTRIVVDVLAPQTSFAVQGTSAQVSGALFARLGSTAAISAFDFNVGTAPAAGVARINAYVDGTPSAHEGGAANLVLAEGPRLIEWTAVDRVGNASLASRTTVYVDGTAPVSTAAIIGAGRTEPSGRLVIAAGSSVTLTAADSTIGGAASGGESITFTDGQGTAVSSASPATLNLPAGVNNVVYSASDRLGNAALASLLTVVVDTSAPAIAAVSPSAGADFLAGRDLIGIAFTVADDYDNAPAVTASLIQTVDLGGSRGTLPAAVVVQTGQSVDPAALDDGMWRLQVLATDFLGNAATVYGGEFKVTYLYTAISTKAAGGTPELQASATAPFTLAEPEAALSAAAVAAATSQHLELLTDLYALRPGAAPVAAVLRYSAPEGYPTAAFIFNGTAWSSTTLAQVSSPSGAFLEARLSTTAPVVLATLADVGRPPVATDDVAQTDEDTAVEVAVLANDSDPNGDTLSISAIEAPANGTAAVQGSSIRYTPNPDFNGADSFGYTVTDLREGTVSARVAVTVLAINDAPVAVADAAYTPEDTQVALSLLANDQDVDGDTLALSAPAHSNRGGTLTVQGTSLLYMPPVNFFGTDSFPYSATDGLLAASTSVTVVVGSVNDLPTAVADSGATPEDTAVLVSVLENDYDLDGDTLTLTSAGPLSAHDGTVAIAGDAIRYIPAADFFGTDSFTYTVTDGTATASAQVSVTVAPVDDPPVAMADSAMTQEDNSVSIAVLGDRKS
ncbi:tandem-95 repeat protein, partial [bacterium]